VQHITERLGLDGFYPVDAIRHGHVIAGITAHEAPKIPVFGYKAFSQTGKPTKITGKSVLVSWVEA
jgi:hypothetical protein